MFPRCVISFYQVGYDIVALCNRCPEKESLILHTENGHLVREDIENLVFCPRLMGICLLISDYKDHGYSTFPKKRKQQ